MRFLKEVKEHSESVKVDRPAWSCSSFRDPEIP
jgi:hypothetical protein